MIVTMRLATSALVALFVLGDVKSAKDEEPNVDPVSRQLQDFRDKHPVGN